MFTGPSIVLYPVPVDPSLFLHFIYLNPHIGAFHKAVAKATLSFVMSFCPSVRPTVCLSVCPHRTPQLTRSDFRKVLCCGFNHTLWTHFGRCQNHTKITRTLHLSYGLAGNDKKSVANIRRKYFPHEEQEQVVIKCRFFDKIRIHIYIFIYI